MGLHEVAITPQKSSEDLGAHVALFKQSREGDMELALVASQQARALLLCLQEEDVVRGSRAEGASVGSCCGKSLRGERSLWLTGDQRTRVREASAPSILWETLVHSG